MYLLVLDVNFHVFCNVFGGVSQVVQLLMKIAWNIIMQSLYAKGKKLFFKQRIKLLTDKTNNQLIF